jgi:hypothetical protein
METIQPTTKRKAIKPHKCNYCELPIHKGSLYEVGVFKFDDSVYTWKNHIACAEIASKLKMYDYCDEGLTEEDFQENISEEYQRIMSDTQNELYESEGFVYPPFSERLRFVMNHYGISF